MKKAITIAALTIASFAATAEPIRTITLDAFDSRLTEVERDIIYALEYNADQFEKEYGIKPHVSNPIYPVVKCMRMDITHHSEDWGQWTERREIRIGLDFLELKFKRKAIRNLDSSDIRDYLKSFDCPNDYVKYTPGYENGTPFSEERINELLVDGTVLETYNH